MSPLTRNPQPRRAALLLALALAACSSSSAPEPIACDDRAECPPDALCRAGACVQSAPPLARIASLASEAPQVNRVLAFDASASADPDPDDRVVGFTWRAKRVRAACEPSVVEAVEAVYRVLFPCAGEFRVEVVVTDSAGVASSPAALDLSVAADELSAPALRTGAALALDHRCEGEPLVCTPVGENGATTFPLFADATSGRGPVALRWTASQPGGISAPYSIAFSDSSAAAPTVALLTSGEIAGTWTFTVVATDADGRSAVAEQQVVIGNRAPVLVEPIAALAVEHRHDPLDESYRAEGSLPAWPRFSDPDGDPVSLRFAAEASDDGGHGFSVGPDGAFSIRIPAGEPQHLIGEAVIRRIAVQADDGNGGRAGAAVPLTVLNRPPRIAVARSVATVPHRYDAARRVYSAAATLSDYVDDDGDPLLPGSTFELVPAGCSRLSLSGATLELGCEVPFSTVAALASLARVHVLDVTVRDPWAHSLRATARLEVTNQPPSVTGSISVNTPSTMGNVCCALDEDEWYDVCVATSILHGPGDASFSGVVDPDGDPLDVSYENTSPALSLSRTSASACTGADCAVGVHLDAAGSLSACVKAPDPGALRVVATDGASSSTVSVAVSRSW